MDQQQYNEYISRITPKNSVPVNVFRAFITGGTICAIGQALTNLFLSMGMEKEIATSVMQLCLIGASILLTGLNLFPMIAKFGGAGALVPITGFANSVAAPAIEYKAHGQVFGIGCKIFTIAGPVILYGVFTSWVLGLIYWGWISITAF